MALSTLKRGDDWKFTINILTPDGTAKDVTGGSVWLTFKDKADLGNPDTGAAFQLKDLDLQDANDPENVVATGFVVLRANSAGVATNPSDSTTAAGFPGTFNYDVQYQEPGVSGAITTIDSGNVTVSWTVTDSQNV